MRSKFQSTKVLELGSCAFRQPNAAFNRSDAGDNSKRCSFIHGYRLKAKFWFGCFELDDKNWVQDFGAFGPIKETFKHQFDHTTCLSADDPLLPLFQQIHDAGGLDLRVMEKGTGIERIAEYCFDQMQSFVQGQSSGRVWVDRVEVFEHENNSAIYDNTAKFTGRLRNNFADPADRVVRVEDVKIASEAARDVPGPVYKAPDRAAPLYCKTDKSLADILAGR